MPAALQFSGTLPSSDITNNGSLILAPSSSVIFTNNLSGPGTLTMSGTALLTLSNANTYAGGTTNTSGGLMLVNNSSIGNGPLTYNGGMVFVGNNAVITNDFTIPGSATSDLSMAGTNNNTGHLGWQRGQPRRRRLLAARQRRRHLDFHRQCAAWAPQFHRAARHGPDRLQRRRQCDRHGDGLWAATPAAASRSANVTIQEQCAA